MVVKNANEATAPTMGLGGVCVWQDCGLSHGEVIFVFNLLYKITAYILLSARFAKIMMQKTVLLFSTKSFIPVKSDGTYRRLRN